MKKLLLCAMVFLFLAAPLCLAQHAIYTPNVRYMYPRNDSEVDLTEEESIILEEDVEENGEGSSQAKLYADIGIEIPNESKHGIYEEAA